MAFEKTAMDQVKYDVAVEHQEKINPWFEKGTMWCDYINEDVKDEQGKKIGTFGSILERLKVNPDDNVAQKYARAFANNLLIEGGFGAAFPIVGGLLKKGANTDVAKFLTKGVKEASVYIVESIPLKGLTLIIENAEILKNEKAIQFYLIGTGFELEKIKNLVKKLQLKNVKFSGWIEYDKLPDAINDFDICLGIFGDTPKSDLVIPNKIYHYAALKKCIITKETLAIKEVFTNQKNIILSSNSPKDIATQILTLKKDSSLTSSIADGAFKLINDSYNSNKIADQFISILKNFKQH